MSHREASGGEAFHPVPDHTRHIDKRGEVLGLLVVLVNILADVVACDVWIWRCDKIVHHREGEVGDHDVGFQQLGGDPERNGSAQESSLVVFDRAGPEREGMGGFAHHVDGHFPLGFELNRLVERGVQDLVGRAGLCIPFQGEGLSRSRERCHEKRSATVWRCIDNCLLFICQVHFHSSSFLGFCGRRNFLQYSRWRKHPVHVG